MCGVCGCQDHQSMHDHQHTHHGDHTHENILHIERDILSINQAHAAHNREYFLNSHIIALNIMSSPGSGKTTLLTKTMLDLKHQRNFAVIVGDQQTSLDADLLQSTGVQALQINTGKGCHLDAHQVGHVVSVLSLKKNAILFIENVGNLVCPALFDLGELRKIVLLSVTEGDNKPLKYPDMFRKADLLLITKTDLLPYVDFDQNQCIQYAKRINPELAVLSLSTKSGEGLHDWYAWLDYTF